MAATVNDLKFHEHSQIVVPTDLLNASAGSHFMHLADVTSAKGEPAVCSNDRIRQFCRTNLLVNPVCQQQGCTAEQFLLTDLWRWQAPTVAPSPAGIIGEPTPAPSASQSSDSVYVIDGNLQLVSSRTCEQLISANKFAKSRNHHDNGVSDSHDGPVISVGPEDVQTNQPARQTAPPEISVVTACTTYPSRLHEPARQSSEFAKKIAPIQEYRCFRICENKAQ